MSPHTHARTLITFLLATLLLANAAHATTRYVNGTCGNDAWQGIDETCASPTGPYRTIGRAILAAVNGDTILVAPGTYNESINFAGKTIALMSTGGRDVTTIDGSGIDDSVVLMISGEGTATLFEGFTVTGGVGRLLNSDTGYRRGGGLYLLDASPTIRDCRFVGNSASDGGGSLTRNDAAHFIDCIFENNMATNGGGAHAAPDLGANPLVQFVDCQFIDNIATNRGGGLFLSGGDINRPLTLSQCTFSGNSAAYGGGVSRQNGSHRYVNCMFEDNTAGLGGAAYSRVFQDDTLMVIESCVLEANSASGGGALYLETDTLPFGEPKNNLIMIVTCDFTANDATIGGGAVYCDHSTPMLINSEFANNEVDVFLGVGGAISSQNGGHPSIQECTLSQGSARSGGLVYVGPSSSATLVSCILSESSAYQGGAVFLDVKSNFHADYCVFVTSSADGGGALWSDAENCFLNTCTFAFNAADSWGAAIMARAGELQLNDSEVLTNTSNGWAGGIFVTELANLHAANTIFEANRSIFQGGAGVTSRNGGYMEFDGCTFAHNMTGSMGGGVQLQNGNSAVFRNSTFLENESSAIHGGFVTAEDCVFDGNEAQSGGSGGAINSYLDSVTLRRCEFRNHSTLAVAAADDSVLEDCIFSNNTSGLLRIDSGLIRNCAFNGGNRAIEVFGGPLLVDDCTLEGLTGNCFVGTLSDVTLVNCDVHFGGAIAISGSSLPQSDRYFRAFNCTFSGIGPLSSGSSFTIGLQLTNCLITGVSAIADGLRGADVVDIRNCTIATSTPHFTFGSQTSQLPSVNVVNSILVGATPATTNTDLVHINYSLITDGWPGVGNISGQPSFIDASNGDYRLKAGSACIDAGFNNAVGFDFADLDNDGDTEEFVPVDLDGNPRFRDRLATPDTGCGVGRIVDMGAYERQQGPENQPTFADIDGDSVVAGFDLAQLLGAWGDCMGACCLADLNADGTVDGDDLALLLGAWTVD